MRLLSSQCVGQTLQRRRVRDVDVPVPDLDPAQPPQLLEGPRDGLPGLAPTMLANRPRAPCGGGGDLTTVPHVYRRFLTIPDDGRSDRRRNNSLRPELRPAAAGPGAPQAAYRPT
jgi:hypothetical protein